MSDNEVREGEIYECKKKVTEAESKIKQQEHVLESVVGERNLYSKNLIEAQVWMPAANTFFFFRFLILNWPPSGYKNHSLVCFYCTVSSLHRDHQVALGLFNNVPSKCSIPKENEDQLRQNIDKLIGSFTSGSNPCSVQKYIFITQIRNKGVSDALCLQEEMVEIKRNMGIMSNQVSRLRDEITGKELALAKDQQEHKRLEKNNDVLKVHQGSSQILS